MKKWFAASLEKALNRYLGLDPESAEKLRKLQGKTVTIELSGISLTLQMIFSETSVILSTNDFVPADTVIQGGPVSLLHIALSPMQRKSLFAENVTMTGDLDLGQDVIALFDEIEIDWEEHLSHWVGDMPAHHVGRFVRHLKNVGQQVQQSMTQNVNEYVHEEVDLFPSPEALQDFFCEVDELRMDVDRLDVQLQRYKN